MGATVVGSVLDVGLGESFIGAADLSLELGSVSNGGCEGGSPFNLPDVLVGGGGIFEAIRVLGFEEVILVPA